MARSADRRAVLRNMLLATVVVLTCAWPALQVVQYKESGLLIEIAGQIIIVSGVLTKVSRTRKGELLLERLDLGYDENPASSTKGNVVARKTDTPDQSLPDDAHPDQSLPGDAEAPDQSLPDDSHPDQGLPEGQPGAPDQSLPEVPAAPDNSLPGHPDNPNPGLPPLPDQGLPPEAGQPDQGLPTDPDNYPDQGLPPEIEVEPPTDSGGKPDNSLPVPPGIVGGPTTPKGRWVFIPRDLTDRYKVRVSLESK